MPRATAKSKRPHQVGQNGSTADVLTLNEAANYLRLSEADVVHLVNDQGLPARRVGNDWRFLKRAIEAWLSTPASKREPQGIWAAAGALKDDPYLDGMLREIEKLRGRPTAEDD
jgi:excisionase family DNA binding protein